MDASAFSTKTAGNGTESDKLKAVCDLLFIGSGKSDTGLADKVSLFLNKF